MKAHAAPFKGNDRLLFGMIFGVLSFWLFAQTMLNINVPMATDLGMETSMMNLAVSITSLISGIFIVVWGGLADRFGRMKIMRIGFLLSIVGSLLVGFTPVGSSAGPVLTTGRILQGLAGAAIMPSSLALVKAYWEGRERQRAISLWSIGSWGGSGFASLFGGVMLTVGWRYIFFSGAALSLVGLFMVKGTPESKAESKGKMKFDFVGLIVFMIAMLTLQVLLSKGVDFGWTSPTSLVLMAAVIILFAIFYFYENRKTGAFINFKLFKNRIFTGATISNLLLNATAGILIVSLTLLQVGGGVSAFDAGLLTLGYAITVVLFIRMGEKLLRRYGHRMPMLLGSLIVGVAIALLMFTNVMTDTYKILAVIAYTLFGLGLAFFATPSTDAALSNLPEEQAGAGAGIYKMASSIGAGLGVAISAGIFTTLKVGEDMLWLRGVLTFVGRQDNVVVRQAATIALGVELLMVVLAVVSILLTIPKSSGKSE